MKNKQGEKLKDEVFDKFILFLIKKDTETSVFSYETFLRCIFLRFKYVKQSEYLQKVFNIMRKKKVRKKFRDFHDNN